MMEAIRMCTRGLLIHLFKPDARFETIERRLNRSYSPASVSKCTPFRRLALVPLTHNPWPVISPNFRQNYDFPQKQTRPEAPTGGVCAFINFFGVIHRLRTRLIQVKRMDCSRAPSEPMEVGGGLKLRRGWMRSASRYRGGGSIDPPRGGCPPWITGTICWNTSCIYNSSTPTALAAVAAAAAAYIFLINCLSNVYVNTVC